MIRKIIKINEEKCNGCGLCAAACHEGAIGMVDGKARLLREDYCDGLGDCLPACPTGAIAFEEREAPAYDHEAVMAAKAESQGEEDNGGSGKDEDRVGGPLPCGCPGTMSRTIQRKKEETAQSLKANEAAAAAAGWEAGALSGAAVESRLSQWPVQIKLAPANAPYFQGASLLIAADCTAYAYGDFHRRFIRGKVTLIGCPKLDEGDYAEKLTEILGRNDIKKVTVVRMEVPCCGGIENAVKRALSASGKMIPWQVVTISTDGRIIEE